MKAGYARNFLLPQGKAVVATPANVDVFQARRAELNKLSDKLAHATARTEKLAALEGVSIPAKAGDEANYLALSVHVTLRKHSPLLALNLLKAKFVYEGATPPWSIWRYRSASRWSKSNSSINYCCWVKRSTEKSTACRCFFSPKFVGVVDNTPIIADISIRCRWKVDL